MRMQRYRDSWIYPLTLIDIFSTKFRRKRTGYTSGYNKKANIRMSDKIAVSIQVIVCFYQLSVREGCRGDAMNTENTCFHIILIRIPHGNGMRTLSLETASRAVLVSISAKAG